MSSVRPDYRLLWLRRLDALWQAKPEVNSFWGSRSLFKEMRGVIGDSYDQEASGDALWALVMAGMVRCIEGHDGDFIVAILPPGRAELARLENTPS